LLTIRQEVHSANIIAVAVSSDESLVATGSTDRTIAIFSLASVAGPEHLEPVAVLKVADAVCLDISWGR
jgi:WD40 repeat protein